MNTQTAKLLADVDAFIERTGIGPSVIGREALNDHHFVRQLREGRRCWPETEQKVRDFMARHGKSRDGLARE